MSFEPTFTLLSPQHGESKRKQYKCNLCALDFKKHITLSVSPGSYCSLKRHINSTHSEVKENFEEMCQKSRIDNYEAGMRQRKLKLLNQKSVKHQTQNEYQKHQVCEVKTINVNQYMYIPKSSLFEFYMEFRPKLIPGPLIG